MAKVWIAQGRPSPIRISNTLLPMELDTAMSPIPEKDRETVETKTEIESTNTFNSASVKWGITHWLYKKISATWENRTKSAVVFPFATKRQNP